MRGKDIIGIFNLLIIVGVLGAISYAALVLQPDEYDPETLCLTGEPSPHLAVVIDKTDRYSPPEAERIRGLILDARDQLAVGERLSLYELDENGRLSDAQRFSMCNPGRGDQINPLYRNPARVETRYQDYFEGPLAQRLADLVEPKDAPRSPILESLARLSTQDAFAPGLPRREVVLVSDMLQNSDLFTVYGAARWDLSRLPDPDRVAEELAYEYGDALAGVRLTVYLIPRPGWEQAQRTALPEYWNAVFAQLGVRVRWRAL